MSIDKKKLIAAAIGCVLCLAAIGLIAIGFFIGKRVYDRPMDTDIQRDTIIVTDTIPQYFPKPVEVEKVRTEYKWLTRIQPVGKTDTLLMRDSVLVEVPIESKHYHATEYDAWVSGYEPSLDSIKVYQRTEYITETITRMKPPNKWELDLMGGVDYNTANKKYTPFAGGELIYKPSRWQVGVRGGIAKQGDRLEPVVGGMVKYRLF